MKLIERLKAIKAILFAEEFFVTVANQQNPYGKKCDGPIAYEYFSNTDRNVFYLFVKDYILKNILQSL
jgi:hypothetical protein